MSLMGASSREGEQNKQGFVGVDLPTLMSGDDIFLPFIFDQPSGLDPEVFEPIDMRGGTLSITLAPSSRCSDTLTIAKYLEDNDVDAEKGGVTLHIPAAVSRELCGNMHYDVEYKSATFRRTLMVGRVVFANDINKEV